MLMRIFVVVVRGCGAAAVVAVVVVFLSISRVLNRSKRTHEGTLNLTEERERERERGKVKKNTDTKQKITRPNLNADARSENVHCDLL